jgi:hypothetical protein
MAGTVTQRNGSFSNLPLVRGGMMEPSSTKALEWLIRVVVRKMTGV